jgi:hypothetical protein
MIPQEARDRLNARTARLLRGFEMFGGTDSLCPCCRNEPKPSEKLKGTKLDAWRRENIHHYACELDILIHSFEHHAEGW